MKHAYLILAHTEFEILKFLIASLDDARNHIFIHFDKKVVELPELQIKYARLTYLTNRIDVRWGDKSVVEAELALFDAAYKIGEFNYYHLLSGVDMPLKSQDYIHEFFKKNNGKEFIGYFQGNVENEITRKVKKVHLFSKDFRSNGTLLSLVKKITRAVFVRLQYLFSISRYESTNFKKGTQWVSITPNLVELVLKNKSKLLHLYKNSFCSDEIFLQTLCWNSSLKENIYNVNDEAYGCMRMISWKDGEMLTWTNQDYNILIESNFLFARKFTNQHIKVVKRIFNRISGHE